MADNLMLNVRQDTNLQYLSEELAAIYRGKGFAVNVARMSDSSCVLTFDKGTGGINMLLGMGLGVKATLMLNNGMLSATYSDAEWTGKIIGLGVGWIVCFVPFITAIVGTFNQMNLPKNINSDITMLANR